MKGLAIQLTGPDGNIDQVIENVGLAAECGNTKQTNILYLLFDNLQQVRIVQTVPNGPMRTSLQQTKPSASTAGA